MSIRVKRVLEPEWVSRMPSAGRHFVYTLWGRKPGFDPEEDLVCIYVGVTSDLRARLGAHSRKWWWVAVDPESCEFEECFTREEANLIEKQTIRMWQPEMNRAGRLLIVTEV
jgi:hypothetical protein